MDIVLPSREIAAYSINLVRLRYVAKQNKAGVKENASDTRIRNEDDQKQESKEQLDEIREKPCKSPVVPDCSKRGVNVEQEDIQPNHAGNSK